MNASGHDQQRFYRRVAFGRPVGTPLPSDPLAWAKTQLNAVPPIDILEPDGTRRADLPAAVQLRWEMDEVMHAFEQHRQLDRSTREQARHLSTTEYRSLRQQQIRLPYYQMEHWKEVQARATTALYGSAPVFERFWHFWTNHFMVAPGTQTNDTLVGPYQRNLRMHMVGSFRELLWHAVTHPGMLVYLDNNLNTGPRSTAAIRKWTRNTINENLGRELLELFTLSPASGYTQADVEATTLILTGWRDMRPDQHRKPGVALGTYFDFDRHEPGTQVVMGKPYAAWFRPSGKLEDLITDLANHPATARHLAQKLCIYFLDDQPPAPAIAHVEQAFVRTQGHLPSVHAAVVDACWTHLGNTRKFLAPETWLLQTWTLMGLSPYRAMPMPGHNKGLKTQHVLADLGQAIPRCPQPDGWPIRSTDWISQEMLDRRVRLMALITRDWLKTRPRTQAVLSRLIEDHLPPDQSTAQLLRKALNQGDPSGAHTLFHISPEMLWS